MAEGVALEGMLLDNVRDYAVFTVDREGLISSWNPGASRLKGYASEEIVGRHVSVLYPLEDAAAAGDLLKRCAQEGSLEVEGWRLRADGTRFWARVLVSAIRSGAGELLGFAKITQDRTAERAAQSERQFAESLIEHMAGLVIVLDRDNRIVRFNRACQELTGYTFEEVRGRDFLEFLVPPDEAAGVRDRCSELAAGDFPNTHENDWITRAGERRTIRWSNTVRLSLEGDVEYILGTGIDVTHQRQVEAAERRILAEQSARAVSEELHARYQLLFQRNPHPMLVMDLETRRFLDVNDSALAQYGYTREEFAGLDMEDLRSGACPGERSTGTANRRVCSHRRKDGSLLDVEVVTHELEFSGRRAQLVLARDLTEELRLRRQNQDALERYALIGRATNDAVWDWDLASGALTWNGAVRSAFGFGACEDPDRVEWWHERIHPEERREVLDSVDRALAGSDTVWSLQYRFQRGDGTYAFILDRGFIVRDAAGRAVRMIGSVLDLSDRRRAEDQQRFLAEAGEALNGLLDRAAALQAVARLAVPTLADCCLVDLLDERGDVVRAAEVHEGPELARALETHPPRPGSRQPAADAMRDRAPVVTLSITRQDLQGTAIDDDHLALLERLGPTSVVAVPIMLGEELLGALTLMQCRSARRYDSRDVALAQDLARRIALALDRARLLERLRAELAERRRAEHDLGERMKELRCLMAVSGLLLEAGDDLEEALPRAVQLLPPAFQYPEVASARLVLRGSEIRSDGYAESPWRLEVPVLLPERRLGTLEVVYREERPPADEGPFLAEERMLLEALAGRIADATRRAEIRRENRQLQADLERLVEERTAELAAANQELEAFAYSVSHDLRAPLRSVDGFSLALMEDCAGSLDEIALDYLRRIRAASQRMGQLIDDMLVLSRVTRAEITPRPLDLSAMAAEIAAELQKAEPARSAEFRLQPGVVAFGDPRLLRIALTNLLANAWKFSSRNPQAHIEFGSCLVDGRPTFFVRDDGVGFDMAYVGKLFSPFQRLHPAREFSGTGVGLAIVQRVVNRHAGRAWAEGEPGRGASFYFQLGAP